MKRLLVLATLMGCGSGTAPVGPDNPLRIEPGVFDFSAMIGLQGPAWSGIWTISSVAPDDVTGSVDVPGLMPVFQGQAGPSDFHGRISLTIGGPGFTLQMRLSPTAGTDAIVCDQFSFVSGAGEAANGSCSFVRR